MRSRTLGFVVALLCARSFAQNTQGLIGSGGIDAGTPFTTNAASYSVVPNMGVRVQMGQRLAGFGLDLSSVDWSAYTHVLVTVTNNAPNAVQAEVAIDSGTSNWAWSDVIIGGNATETFAVPLQSAMSLQSWAGWPAVNGSTNQTMTFGTVTKNSIRKVRILNIQRAASEDLTIAQMAPTYLAPQTTSIIDQYGQPTISFPGQVTSDSQLQQQAVADAQLSGQLPYSNDVYGGVAGSAQDSGTGRWRTALQNGKWYIIDPLGNRFFSTGVLCVATGTLAYTQNRSALFAAGALPSQSGSFAGNYQYPTNPATGAAEPGYNFYTSNLQRKYGASWSTPAISNATRRLRTWGFNTIGPSSAAQLYDPAQQFANMQQTGVTGTFRTIPCLYGGAMPDVYDSAWATAVGTSLSPVVTRLNSDPYNVGLFVDNELPWAFDWSQMNYRYDLAFNVLSAPSNQPAKTRLLNTLSMTYRTIGKLNLAWGTSFSSWTAMQSNRNFRPSNVNSYMARDLQSFLSSFANQYYSTIRSKLTSLNYRGLYLGSRLFYYSPEAISAAARYCDVVSFNAYDLTPSQWRSDLKNLGKPVMVSEFGFGAMDHGRVGGGFPSPISDTDRIQAYQTYVADAMTWPNLVGLHWYKWDDDPVSGRMWDNSNQTLGLVTITDMPYASMVNAATQANTSLSQRLLNP